MSVLDGPRIERRRVLLGGTPSWGTMTGDLLRLRERPTAIFAASDTQALGALDAARSLGIRVPEELSVIGSDDIEVAGFVGLTTVRQPLLQSGRRGAVRWYSFP